MPRISLCISESVCFRQSGTVPGSSRSELLCEFHWRPYSKSFLKTFVIVKMDVLVDGRMQLAAAIELIQGIHLCLHNSPEPFHWAILAIKNPPKAVWLFTLSALGGSYHSRWGFFMCEWLKVRSVSLNQFRCCGESSFCFTHEFFYDFLHGLYFREVGEGHAG